MMSSRIRTVLALLTILVSLPKAHAKDPLLVSGTHDKNDQLIRWLSVGFVGGKVRRDTDGSSSKANGSASSTYRPRVPGIRVQAWHRSENILRFAEGRCDVMVQYYHPLTEMDNLVLLWKLKTQTIETYYVGQAKVIVIAHPSSEKKTISLAELGGRLRGNIHRRALPKSGKKERKVNFWTEGKDSWSRSILRQKCLGVKDAEGTVVVYKAFRSSVVAMESAEQIVTAVRRNSKGVGCFLYTGQDVKGLDNVKVMAVVDAVGQRGVAPRLKPIIEEDYPLSEPLILYLHPKAPPLARKFCEFAVSEEGAKIAAKYGLITPWHQNQYEGELRLKQFKSGKGVRLSAVGVRGGKAVMGAMAIEYVRTKEVVRLSYAPASSAVSAVGRFVAGGMGKRELLLLDDKPSERALKMFGRKWNALGTDGTGPTEYVVAGRVVAIIVNSANKLKSLTLEQVQAIFGGKIRDWSVVGDAGLSRLSRPRGGRALGTGAGMGIHAFGLSPRDSATKLFEAECLPAWKFRRVKRVKGTTAAVAAVGMDPNAIAYVDLTAIPAAGQGVKVLAIGIGSGKKARAIAPTAQNIKNAMYPLSRRLYLYVHPNASDAAKRFATFLATCGGSERASYSGTVKAVMAAYRKHGLIPLADAATERMTKEAIAEAVKKAAAAKSKNRKGRRRK